jgi:hypothetical protein
MAAPERVPTLSEIAQNTGALDRLPRPVLCDLLRQTWHLLGEIEAALARCPSDGGPEALVLDLDQVAALLKTSKDSLYPRQASLPFLYKDPIDNKLKGERASLERWIRKRVR